ncbi:MAG: hypothetical protein HHAS10_04530 [Candidatus Altimarinota bacterium]
MALKKDAILGDVYVSLAIVAAVSFLANIFFLRRNKNSFCFKKSPHR